MSKAVLVIDMPERFHDCPFLDGDDAWLNDPQKMVHRSTKADSNNAYVVAAVKEKMEREG